jgi:hypothetical protein
MLRHPACRCRAQKQFGAVRELHQASVTPERHVPALQHNAPGSPSSSGSKQLPVFATAVLGNGLPASTAGSTRGMSSTAGADSSAGSAPSINGTAGADSSTSGGLAHLGQARWEALRPRPAAELRTQRPVPAEDAERAIASGSTADDSGGTGGAAGQQRASQASSEGMRPRHAAQSPAPQAEPANIGDGQDVFSRAGGAGGGAGQGQAHAGKAPWTRHGGSAVLYPAPTYRPPGQMGGHGAAQAAT